VWGVGGRERLRASLFGTTFPACRHRVQQSPCQDMAPLALHWVASEGNESHTVLV
jgi:hypothetical protein